VTLQVTYDRTAYAPGDTITMSILDIPAPVPVVNGWKLTYKTASKATFTRVNTMPTGKGKITVAMNGQTVKVLPPLGTYDPDGTTCGYAHTGKVLTPYPATGGPAGNIVNGDLTIVDNGAYLDGYDIKARVIVKAKGVHVRRSLVRGNPNKTNPVALIYANDANVEDLLIEDVTMSPSKPMPSQNGFFGHDTTLNRVDMAGVTDGIGAYHPASIENNVTITGCRIALLAGHCPDYPLNRPMTHNDCVQIHGGRRVTALGNAMIAVFHTDIPSRDGTMPPDQLRDEPRKNALNGYNPYWGKRATGVGGGTFDYRVNTNAALQVNQPETRFVDYLIWKFNYCDGGIYCLNLAPALGSHSDISYNRFGRRLAKVAGNPGADAVKQVGNVWADNGKPVAWGRAGYAIPNPYDDDPYPGPILDDDDRARAPIALAYDEERREDDTRTVLADEDDWPDGE
jgi:hypothetical protein